MSTETKLTPLRDIARVIRSKNAGPYEVTLDVILPSRQVFETVVRSRSITPERIAAAYGIEVGDVRVLTEFPEGNAIKITLRRRVPSGALGDTDIMAAQQHVPLMQLSIPIDDRESQT